MWSISFHCVAIMPIPSTQLRRYIVAKKQEPSKIEKIGRGLERAEKVLDRILGPTDRLGKKGK